MFLTMVKIDRHYVYILASFYCSSCVHLFSPLGMPARWVDPQAATVSRQAKFFYQAGKQLYFLWLSRNCKFDQPAAKKIRLVHNNA